MVERLMVNMASGKVINTPVDRWDVSEGILHVWHGGEAVFAAAPGQWTSAIRGTWGDVFIKPNGYLVKDRDPNVTDAQPEGEPL